MTSFLEDHDAPGGASHVPRDRPTRAAVFGEILFDHFPDGSRVLGGAPFNVAWHLCGFAADPLLISAVGDDEPGREILDHMDSWGLDTRLVAQVSGYATGRVDATIQDGEPTFEIARDQAWDHVPRPESDLLDAEPLGLLYHGSLAARSGDSRRTLRMFLEEYGLPTFVDINLRPPWWTGELVEWSLSRARWVKLSLEELAALTESDVSRLGAEDGCVEAARRLRDRHDIPWLVVTRGSAGSVLLQDDEWFQADAPTVVPIVDTVGAGDAFSSVLILGILADWPPDTMLQRASGFAADVCRLRGATTTDLTAYETHQRKWAEDTPVTRVESDDRPLHIMSLSLHGLVRGQNIELGRDADTGGQVSYVVDQARALASHPRVGRVDVITRQVHDRGVDSSYAEPSEPLGEGARIVRIPFGPRRYLHKESLWPYLDGLLDQLTRYVRSAGSVPDIIHSHYADAGYVGAQLAHLLGVPFVFTGHSLGRVKRERLLADGADRDTLEERYHLSQRIEAEEQALEAASLVITSTRQEVREQYEGYDHYLPGRMKVIPPGVDLARFSPPSRFWTEPAIAREINRFLTDPEKPMILALARADDRKNFGGLLHAYGGTPGLREIANLVIVAGNRDDIAEMAPAPRRVLTRILMLVDRYDLYGSVAYPKHHTQDDVPDIFRMAAHSRGVFVNPAVTEPFGLTLIEAAASGLPVVATNDGGPRDILDALDHGVLADPLDPQALGQALLDVLSDRRRWALFAKSAVSLVHRRFSWKTHARRYVRAVDRHVNALPPAHALRASTRLPRMDRILLTDLDGTLVGDREGLSALRARLDKASEGVGIGLATGRTLQAARAILSEWDLPDPDVLITASGGQLHYGPRLVRDRSWERRIHHRWEPAAVVRTLADVPGLTHDGGSPSVPTRLRYRLEDDSGLSLAAIRRRLRHAGLQVTLLLDHERYVDVLPGRASPGLAIRFFCFKWDLPPERLLVAGDSGNDAEMLSGDTLGVVVGNHDPELDFLRGHRRIYFAERPHAWGILEGIDHYDFLGAVRVPEEERA
jgi:sucrose-phosphate synthase